jgi:hypothetical protein
MEYLRVNDGCGPLERPAKPARTAQVERKFPPGPGLVIALVLSLFLWAGLIYAAMRLWRAL